jgi:hypothetical protein
MLNVAGVIYDANESDMFWGKVSHYGSNEGGCNVVYGGSQIFSGGTIYFGT